MVKITVIYPFCFGYVDNMICALQSRENTIVTHIKYSEIRYKYKSVYERGKNFILKTCADRNLKKEYKTEVIKRKLANLERQDYILVIRPDLLTEDIFPYLRNKTRRLISYYFDAINNFPEKEKYIKYFDKVYSYEKDDVKKHNLEFITNYYSEFKKIDKPLEYSVYNISSYDKRFKHIQNIAKELKAKGSVYKFIVRKEKPVHCDYVEITDQYIPLERTHKELKKALALLDIQKDNQKGLSFRVFEAMALEKKLITTNEDIVTYDFYNPNNILVLDLENIDIPLSFLNTPYDPLPEALVYKYSLANWINTVFES
ncbi:hypothetical protein [Abyssalbus ytuae]|uniref:Uncharacterized protein n=1 Tax=Abyssalbus ytuae TaxID=2926907 RepID=A0A9E7CUE3_9FLAO|nr:hypothetical protein [Abyssalbus ytuae]UOB18267.1 hypothetical protein MQE35_02970 [Abyssalbus ytuae]